jgi:hypothetical protein
LPILQTHAERAREREDGRVEIRERKKAEREGERDGGGDMEAHSTYKDT